MPQNHKDDPVSKISRLLNIDMVDAEELVEGMRRVANQEIRCRSCITLGRMNDMPKNQKVPDLTGRQAELTTFFPSPENERCADCGADLTGKSVHHLNSAPYCRKCYRIRVKGKSKKEA